MKICNFCHRELQTPLGEIRCGEVFLNNFYYMKVLDELGATRAVELSSGRIWSFSPGMEVIPIRGYFHVQGKGRENESEVE